MSLSISVLNNSGESIHHNLSLCFFCMGLMTLLLVFYQLESYWTYELCHGRYIRQYHEEREGKKVKLQEYYLGMWNKTQFAKLSKCLS